MTASVARGNRSPGRLFVTCGLPGAGKTTMARTIERELGAVRLTPDEWLSDLGVDLFDVSPRAALEARLWLLAQRLLDDGDRVVIDFGSWARCERDAMRTWCRGRGHAVELHAPRVPFEELVSRVESRAAAGGTALSRADLVDNRGFYEAPDEAERALYDSPLTA